MDSVHSNLMLLIFMMIMIFVIPTLYIEMFISDVRYKETRNQTKLFVDTVISKGVITKEMYSNYLNLLDAKAMSSNRIFIKRIQPVLKEGKVDYEKILCTNFTIEKELDENGIFLCKSGDEILVEIDNDYNSNVNVIMNSIFKFEIPTNVTRYAGIIKNEVF